MAGLTQSVKRAWSFLTTSAGAAVDPFRQFYTNINNLVTDVESIRAYLRQGQDSVVNVEFAATEGCTFAKDANPEDVQTGNVVICSYKGDHFSVATDVVADVSAILAATSTIGTDQFGRLIAYGNKTANIALTVPSTAETELTDIAALAQPVEAATTVGDVPIAVLMIEADSSVWEWGHATNGEIDLDSDTATFYDLLTAPKIYTAMASFALDAAAATFTYGAAVCVLGDGTTLTITGKANVTFVTGEQTVITTGNTGAFQLFVLANDDEIAVQVSSADADLLTAQLAVDDLRPNPLLVELGRIYITNDSGEDFTPGTTNLDATGITTVFETLPAQADFLAKTDLVAGAMTTPESQD